MSPPDHLAEGETVAAALSAGSALSQPRNLPGFVPYTLVHKDMKVEPLVRLLDPERPQRIITTPTFDEHESLALYFNRFKDEASTMFADMDSIRVVAVLDYHESNSDIGEASKAPDTHHPRHGSHRAIFQAKHSPEWQTWFGKNGQKMSQVEFAEFIENNAQDITSPASADLFEMALNMAATKSANFAGKAKLENGSYTFQYSEEINGQNRPGDIEIPREIKLRLRPFMGSEPVEVTARFGYRLDGSSLSLLYTLLRIEHVKRDAFDKIVQDIEVKTERVAMRGRLG
jgi:uncharacterized protein YfdQ (DUF2303 family)